MREARAQLFNVLTLGVGFCLVFTGFNTVSQTQALVYSSATNVTAANNQTQFRVNGLVT